MNKKIILAAETGSDLTPELAEKYGVYLVPMHVSMGGKTYDDGSFPPENIILHYEKHKDDIPHTSASSPEDFNQVFDRIHEEHPDAHIVHLAYSAITTCSYQNAVLVSGDRDYVRSVDTKHVSVGQAAVVLAVAELLKQQPEITLDEAAKAAERIAASTQMCFMPENLDYLRAGGRVSNAAALVGNILHLHPCIEIIDGKLMAKKKYRGSLGKIIPKMLADFDEKHNLDRKHIRFIWSPGLSDENRAIAEAAAREAGFEKIEWMKTGCVITCHGGPGAFGIVGMSR
jgi:DegV family protein with EDD domain